MTGARILEMLPFGEQSKAEESAELLGKGCSGKRRGESFLFQVNGAISCKVFS